MTRPTADRVRQSIFNVIGQSCEGLEVLDLFAGTGALGLEAVSRGATKAVLVDSGREAVSLCRENATSLDFESRVEVLPMPVMRALELLQGRSFELVFSDPPYALMTQSEVLTEVGALVSPGGLVVLEHDRSETLPDLVGRLRREDERVFGSTVVSMYRG